MFEVAFETPDGTIREVNVDSVPRIGETVSREWDSYRVANVIHYMRDSGEGLYSVVKVMLELP